MSALDLLILLSAHFMADFPLQSDWMATNKSKNWWALTTHVVVYSVVVTLAVVFTVEEMYPDPKLLWHFMGLTFLTHFWTDMVTSRITSRLWFFAPVPGRESYAYVAGKRHKFFVMIGFDQLIHAWTLALTWMEVFS